VFVLLLATVTLHEYESADLLFELGASQPTPGVSAGTIDIIDEMIIRISLTINTWPTGWANIIHVGNEDMERLPGIWLQPSSSSTGWHMSFSTIPNNNPTVDIRGSAPLALNTQYDLEIYVTQTALNVTQNGVQIHGDTAYAAHNLATGRNVYVFDPWYPAADVTIHSFSIATFDTVCSCCSTYYGHVWDNQMWREQGLYNAKSYYKLENSYAHYLYYLPTSGYCHSTPGWYVSNTLGNTGTYTFACDSEINGRWLSNTLFSSRMCSFCSTNQDSFPININDGDGDRDGPDSEPLKLLPLPMPDTKNKNPNPNPNPNRDTNHGLGQYGRYYNFYNETPAFVLYGAIFSCVSLLAVIVIIVSVIAWKCARVGYYYGDDYQKVVQTDSSQTTASTLNIIDDTDITHTSIASS
jgi:hypothetical protein